jgi:Fic family protein
MSQQTTPISDWELRQIHRLILLKISPEEAGAYRTLDVQAAGTGYVYPPHYLLNDLVADFIQWLNSETAQSLNPVLFAAEAHARFVSIHPFRDGNGRIGRLLMNLLLLRAGYPIVIITNENRQRYIENLVLGQQSQNWQPFYELVTAATETSLIEMLGVLTTATSGKDRGEQFYKDILDFLTHKISPSN